MRWHRGAKTQYLAVRSKLDYWGVPVTENVMETCLCPEYEQLSFWSLNRDLHDFAKIVTQYAG